MKNFYKLIDEYNLEYYFQVIFKNNPSNNAPYHNLYHTLYVMRNCARLGKSEDLFYNEIRKLMIAALFHDFDHSQGWTSDCENIRRAIGNFLEYSKEKKKDNSEIIDIIRATEYPYIINDNELNISQKIIRDADLLQTFADNNIQQILIGLFMGEMEKNIEEALEIEKSFLKTLTFYTKKAQEETKKAKKKLLKDMDYLTKILLNNYE